MQTDDRIISIAKSVLESCMGIRENETLLIVTDNGKIDLAHDFAAAGRELGVQTILLEIAVQNGGEPPKIVADAMMDADVAILITTGSLTHTQARVNAVANGTRIASMPSLTADVVKNVLAANYNEIEYISTILADMLTEAKEIHVTTALGTDVTLYADGRFGTPDTGKLLEHGAFGNLPAGEAMIAPLECKGNGTIVVDGVISGIGVLDTPLTIDLKDGTISNISGDNADQLRSWIARFDDCADKIAEFGIGSNPKAIIMGNPLVDEKVFGTIHIAFGNNAFMGGNQHSNIHYDMIIKEPTVYLDGVCVIRDGKHLYKQNRINV